MTADGQYTLFRVNPAYAQEGMAEPGRFVLVLRSAVCHIGGESVSKGHYVAYTADRVASEGAGGDAAAAAAVASSVLGRWDAKTSVDA